MIPRVIIITAANLNTLVEIPLGDRAAGILLLANPYTLPDEVLRTGYCSVASGFDMLTLRPIPSYAKVDRAPLDNPPQSAGLRHPTHSFACCRWSGCRLRRRLFAGLAGRLYVDLAKILVDTVAVGVRGADLDVVGAGYNGSDGGEGIGAAGGVNGTAGHCSRSGLVEAAADGQGPPPERAGHLIEGVVGGSGHGGVDLFHGPVPAGSY